MFRKLALSSAAVVALGLAACGTLPSLVQEPMAAPQTAIAEAATFDQRAYVLGVNDRLRVTVFNEANLSNDFVVSQTGVIAMALIGPVQAEGVTVAALESAIAEKLRAGYLRDPRVSVEVLTYRPFYILGEVRSPNSYPYSPGLTVARAVATAQGYTYRANQNRVFIKRGSDQEVAYPAEGTVILPGDIVRVPERFF